jgi:hypothetical protein
VITNLRKVTPRQRTVHSLDQKFSSHGGNHSTVDGDRDVGMLRERCVEESLRD